MAPPGTTSVELDVYDVGRKVDGITVVADIVRLQAEQGQLEVVREFGVQNASKPPRTQMNERNLEFYIPEGAQLIPESATATTETGRKLSRKLRDSATSNLGSFASRQRKNLSTIAPLRKFGALKSG